MSDVVLNVLLKSFGYFYYWSFANNAEVAGDAAVSTDRLYRQENKNG